MRTACAVRAAATGVRSDSSDCIRYAISFICPPSSQPQHFTVPIVFFRAAVCLRQLSESRIRFSFFRERKRPHFRPLAGMSKAIPGRRSPSPEAAPPPARSSRIPASVIRCLCNAPEMQCCDIACNAALTRRPSRMGEDFSLLCRPHEDSLYHTFSGENRLLYGV